MDFREEDVYKPVGSILEQLYEEGVLRIEITGNCFTFSEACDYYFSVKLEKSQLLQLAKELEALANEQ